MQPDSAESRWAPVRKFVFAALCLDALAAGVVWVICLWNGWTSTPDTATGLGVVAGVFAGLGLLSLARGSGWRFDSSIGAGGMMDPRPDPVMLADPAARDDARVIGLFLIASAALPALGWLFLDAVA